MRLAPENGMINAFQRFNCSGFVAATMNADGLKYYESQESKFYSPRTSDINSDFKRKDSCFYKPRISRKVSIKAGDIINVSHAHVIRILKAGEDPLGLSNINEKAKCKDISRKISILYSLIQRPIIKHLDVMVYLLKKQLKVPQN